MSSSRVTETFARAALEEHQEALAHVRPARRARAGSARAPVRRAADAPRRGASRRGWAARRRHGSCTIFHNQKRPTRSIVLDVTRRAWSLPGRWSPPRNAAPQAPIALRDAARAATSTGSSPSTAPIARLVMDVVAGRAAPARLPAQAEQLQSRRRHRARRRGRAAPLRAPRGEDRRRHERAAEDLLRGRQHLHARQLDARVQGQLLQVHERDAPRARGGVARRAASITSPRSTASPPAAATSSRSPARRSSSPTTATAPSPSRRRRSSRVLPGTGGLTRLVDKRKVRRDLADVFSTLAEGVRGKRAADWGLVDRVDPEEPLRSGRCSSAPRRSPKATPDKDGRRRRARPRSR